MFINISKYIFSTLKKDIVNVFKKPFIDMLFTRLSDFRIIHLLYEITDLSRNFFTGGIKTLKK